MNDLISAKHIAIYLPSLGGGGAERVTVMLANGFAARGHRVDLVLPSAQGPYRDKVSAQVKIVDLEKKRVFASIGAFAAYLKREKPDAVISAMAHANIAALMAIKIAHSRAKSIVVEHTSSAFSDAKSYMVHLLRKFLYKRADKIVCVSKGMQEQIASLVGARPEQICTIYNPLDVEYIKRRSQEPVNSELIGERNVPLIVAAGRLTRAKDYPTLLKAFAIARSRKDMRLLILGEGEERERLERMAQELGIGHDVIFAGFQENPFAWMARCDLYVMSSAWEGLPGALLEAMACGAKIVSTDCRTGPNEILEGGKWGRLVPVGDAPELARAMIEALDDDIRPPNVLSRANDFRLDKSINQYRLILDRAFINYS
ncbi:glycosyltransferase (plasmid) [Sphingobium yanoikuyae]|uniref:Glycosyltransferase n=1 Tax=Sphingobium yanoikuyae TaxID=13690 RepID=A0A6M4GGJ1_SPHYA|nr:glycosyltransferase [Sphingobium yanoikuyae]QJR06241.1 glycosyltransferase [Sphingobium yanoikuyae]